MILEPKEGFLSVKVFRSFSKKLLSFFLKGWLISGDASSPEQAARVEFEVIVSLRIKEA